MISRIGNHSHRCLKGMIMQRILNTGSAFSLFIPERKILKGKKRHAILA